MSTMDIKGLNPTLIEALKNSGLIDSAEAKELKDKNKTACDIWLDKYITTYPTELQMKERVRKLSYVLHPVLIHGETGTGKELIARALHGDKPEDKFVPINCAAMPDNLMESILFGHMKGAFTGAEKTKTGLLEQAEGGTIFMDEIGELQMPLQAKLLRAIQEKMIRPIGADSERRISCRFIFATHQNLEDRIEKELFRSDLYYRISTFIIRPQPLSKRSKDILPIVEEIDTEAMIHQSKLRGVSIERFCALITNDMLHGNVRSLQQIVQRYLVLQLLPGEE
jgi:transcriptional regulator with PAS, ATPase and Fis domain